MRSFPLVEEDVFQRCEELVTQLGHAHIPPGETEVDHLLYSYIEYCPYHTLGEVLRAYGLNASEIEPNE